MADEKKQVPPATPEKPKKDVKSAPAKPVGVVAQVPAVVIQTHVDKLEELTKIDLDTLGDLDTADLRKKMLQGVYLLEHVLFSQAGFEFKRIQKLRNLIGQVESEIFDEAKFKQMSESEKLRLYRMMMANMSGSLEFMSNLHKNVTLGIEAVNSIDRIKADKGFMAGAPEDEVKDEVDGIRAMLMEKIASKLKDPNARTEVIKVIGDKPKPKPKPKKKKKPKPKPKPKPIPKPATNVPKVEGNKGGI